MQPWGRQGKSAVHGSGGRERQAGALGHQLKLPSTVEFLLLQETAALSLTLFNRLAQNQVV